MTTDSENAPLLQFSNPHSSLIMTRLHDQRVTGMFCDVILHVGSQTYAAHKNLLAASSLYFESIFLKESSREKRVNADADLGPVHVNIDALPVCPKTFCAVLDYMYLGRVCVDSTCVTDVLMLADEFLLDSLKNYCFAFLEDASHISRTSISCLPDTKKSTEVGLSAVQQQGISQSINTDDYFQASMPEFKLEIPSENVESKCDNLSSKACDEEIKRKSVRRYPNRRSVKIVEPEKIILDAPRIVGNIEFDALVCEHLLADKQIEQLNPCESNVKDNEHTILRKSGCKKHAQRNRLTKKITNRDSKVKLKLQKSVPISEPCIKLEESAETDVDEEIKPGLDVKEVKNEVDPDYNPSESKIIRKTVKDANLNNFKRKRGRPRKDDVFCETFAIRESVAKFSCFWCDCKYKTKCDLAAHVTATHLPEPPYNCDTCGTTCDGVMELIKHRRTHLRLERTFECEICNKRFKKKVSLKQHLRNHSGERPYICPVCGRSVTTKGGLDRHIISHTDHRPWLCHLCGYSTQYQSQLIQHRRVHNGTLYRCEMPNCNYSAKCRTHLKRHMRAHLKIRQHMCSRCPMAFVEKNHLVRHEATHVGARPFKCDRCSYDCNRLDYLKAHKKRCGITFNFFPADVGGD